MAMSKFRAEILRDLEIRRRFLNIGGEKLRKTFYIEEANKRAPQLLRRGLFSL